MTIELTSQQAAGIEAVRKWYEGAGAGFSADVFRWFGYAGTGKTFTAARIPEALDLDKVVFGTYTGKAASVLRRSLQRYGVAAPVTTIHSAIYFPTTSAEAREALANARDEIQACEMAYVNRMEADDSEAAEYVQRRQDELEALLPELEANARRLRFEFNPESEWASADLIVLDEVSMVNAKLAGDIESYGVPILVLGDPAQLPPVEGGGYYTEAEPDWLLTEVQRAALDSPVTALATRVRQSLSPSCGLAREDMEPRSLAAAMEADQVLVWTNKRRWALINAIRHKLDRPAGTPVAGDRIMCLTNSKDLAVFNGEQFEVLASVPGTLGPTLTVRTEAGLQRDIPVFAEGFGGKEAQESAKASGAGRNGQRMLATFAQAITVHKAQGSEWPHVYVVNETPAMISMTQRREGAERAIAQARRWLYTAATRAQERITITVPS